MVIFISVTGCKPKENQTCLFHGTGSCESLIFNFEIQNEYSLCRVEYDSGNEFFYDIDLFHSEKSLHYPIFTLFTWVCACSFCLHNRIIFGYDLGFNVFIGHGSVIKCDRIFSKPFLERGDPVRQFGILHGTIRFVSIW